MKFTPSTDDTISLPRQSENEPMTNFEVVVGTYSGELFGFVVSIPKMGSDTVVFAPSFSVQDANQAIRCLSVSPEGILAAGASDAEIYIYSLRRHRALAVLEGHVGPVRSIIQVPDGAQSKESRRREKHSLASGYAISAGDDSKLVVWRLSDGEMLTSLPLRPQAASSVASHPSMSCFTALAGSSVLLYALDTCKKLGQFSVGRQHAPEVTGDSLVVGGATTPAESGDLGGGVDSCFYHAWRAGQVLQAQASPSDGSEASQLLILSSRALRLVEFQGIRETAAEYRLPDLGTKLTVATFLDRAADTLPDRPAMPSLTTHGILVGDDHGVLRLLEAVSDDRTHAGTGHFRLAVRAKFQLSSSRVKAIVPAPAGILCILFSNGELILASLRSLTEIAILKRLYIPGRPTAACVYEGALDRESLTLLESGPDSPGPSAETLVSQRGEKPH